MAAGVAAVVAFEEATAVAADPTITAMPTGTIVGESNGDGGGHHRGRVSTNELAVAERDTWIARQQARAGR